MCHYFPVYLDQKMVIFLNLLNVENSIRYTLRPYNQSYKDCGRTAQHFPELLPRVRPLTLIMTRHHTNPQQGHATQELAQEDQKDLGMFLMRGGLGR